ncbi:hypothetical protein [Micromonospora sp. CPCC 206061]|uniref:hypothetical protein n=1 Tax=Micromonospora sp. CPCC 206061 TaxID=3122410 RepID=UPI002FF333E5
MRDSDRLSLVILAITAAGVLVLGAWWWVANTPERPASTAPAPVASSWAPADAVGPSVTRVEGGTVAVRTLAATPGGRYLLQHVCFGPGSLTITVQGAEGGTQLHEVDCEGSFDEFELTAAGDNIQVALERPDGDGGQVSVQLVPGP